MAPSSVWGLILLTIGVSVQLAGTALPVPGEKLSVRPDLLAHTFPEHQGSRDWLCLECQAIALALDGMLAAGATVEEIEDFTINECIYLDLFPPDVCSGMVKLCSHEVLYVLQHANYSYNTMCGTLMGSYCGGDGLDPWTLEVPGDKPEPVHPEPEQPTPSVVRILHLTDTHVDLLYDEGSDPYCAHPLCCRHAFGDPAPGEEAAGYWGSHGECDMPVHTMEDMMAQAAELIKPDLVYVTGDLPAHDVWDQSHAYNLLAINVTMNLLKQHFPGIPVINALGNHAPAPVNAYPVPSLYDEGWTISWLYDAVAEMWADWLPEAALADVRRGGFFSFSPLPGLRVVSLNTNYGGGQNWWLMLDNEDPVGQLQWLIDTLLAAEAAGEKVHILGHAHSGSTEDSFSHAFNLIVARFESTIQGMFYGHAHDDNFHVVYDPADYTRPVATDWVTASGTPGVGRNAAFKVFVVDGGHEAATWTLLDAEHYYMNLTEANAEGSRPVYISRYSVQDSYGVPSLTPNSMHQLVLNMVTDEQLVKNHEWNTHNTWADLPDSWSCDINCLKSTLCGFVSSDASNREACQKLEEYIDSVHP